MCGDVGGCGRSGATRSGAGQALAAVVGEDQRLVLPAEPRLVVDREPGVAGPLRADPTDPLWLRRGWIVPWAVTLHVLRAHRTSPSHLVRWASYPSVKPRCQSPVASV